MFLSVSLLFSSHAALLHQVGVRKKAKEREKCQSYDSEHIANEQRRKSHRYMTKEMYFLVSAYIVLE